MDNLKKYINEHRSEFDAEEPEKGHFERLMAKQAPSNMKFFLAIAAAVALLLAFSLIFFNIDNKRNMDDTLLCENSPAMKACYISQMEGIASDIRILTQKYDDFTRDDINMEVDMIVEMNKYFDEELPQELSDKAKQEILKNYYSDNLLCLQAIVTQLNTNL
jgi:hypothetical protein